MTYMGERFDKARIAAMLGHADLGVTDRYLTEISAVRNLDEWKRLWTGHTGDWSRLE